MRLSKFDELVRDEFGPGYAATLLNRHVLTALDSRTPREALAAGVPPRQVWEALCEDMDVPPARRLGIERHAPRP